MSVIHHNHIFLHYSTKQSFQWIYFSDKTSPPDIRHTPSIFINPEHDQAKIVRPIICDAPDITNNPKPYEAKIERRIICDIDEQLPHSQIDENISINIHEP